MRIWVAVEQDSTPLLIYLKLTLCCPRVHSMLPSNMFQQQQQKSVQKTKIYFVSCSNILSIPTKFH